MMKKLTVILFSIFYLITIIGYSVNVHNCSGEIEPLSLQEVESACCCDSIQDIEDCCTVETYSYKLTDDQQSRTNLKLDYEEKVIDLLSSQVLIEAQVSVIEVLHDEYLDISPPPLIQPKWLLNCSPLVYG